MTFLRSLSSAAASRHSGPSGRAVAGHCAQPPVAVTPRRLPPVRAEAPSPCSVRWWRSRTGSSAAGHRIATTSSGRTSFTPHRMSNSHIVCLLARHLEPQRQPGLGVANAHHAASHPCSSPAAVSGHLQHHRVAMHRHRGAVGPRGLHICRCLDDGGKQRSRSPSHAGRNWPSEAR